MQGSLDNIGQTVANFLFKRKMRNTNQPRNDSNYLLPLVAMKIKQM